MEPGSIADTAVPERRRTSGTRAAVMLESGSRLLLPFLLTAVFKMPHTDGGEILRIFLKIRPQSHKKNYSEREYMKAKNCNRFNLVNCVPVMKECPFIDM